MSKLRVHELAKELNVESKILMAKLKAMGAKVLSHQSTLTDQQVNELRGALVATGGASAAPTAAASAAASSESGKPRVVIRRRAATKDEFEGGDITSAGAEAEIAASAPELAVPQRALVPEAPVELPVAPAAEVPKVKVSPAPESPTVAAATSPGTSRATGSTSATIVRSAAPSGSSPTAPSTPKPARIQHPSGFAQRPAVVAPTPRTDVEAETNLVDEQPEVNADSVAKEAQAQPEPLDVAAVPTAPIAPPVQAAPAAAV